MILNILADLELLNIYIAEISKLDFQILQYQRDTSITYQQKTDDFNDKQLGWVMTFWDVKKSYARITISFNDSSNTNTL